MTAVIVQARMGSTRLAGKIMKDLCGKPVLWHVLNRLSAATKIDTVIVATTVLPEDDIIYNSVVSWGYTCTRGSAENVLSRYFHAALEYPHDTIVRVPSDCPFVDPGVCDELIEFFHSNNYRYVANGGPDFEKWTIPMGLNCEVFTFELLTEAYKNAIEAYELEHVTPYMYWKNKDAFFYRKRIIDPTLRWTLDTKEDFTLTECIYNNLYKEGTVFLWSEILKAYENHPEWRMINAGIEEKKVR